MAWKCTICMIYFALTLRILLSHIRREHSTGPNFSVTCNVDGCPETYNKFNSFYRHVQRQHSQRLNVTFQNEDNYFQGTIDHGEDYVDLEFESMNVSDDDQIDRVNDANSNVTTGAQNIKDFNSKDMAIDYITNLKEFQRIRESTVQQIAVSTDAFVQRAVDILQRRVMAAIESAGIQPDTIPNLVEQFSNFELPFNGIQTLHERNKFIIQNYFYVEPEKVILGQQLQPVLRNRRRLLEVVEESYYYVPIHNSIEQLLQNEDILNISLNQRNQPFDGHFLHNLTDGSVYREHPIFSQEDQALQILLYFDDIEICNPLGKKSGVHKLGVFTTVWQIFLLNIDQDFA